MSDLTRPDSISDAISIDDDIDRSEQQVADCYHRLATDATESGLWGAIDRCSDKVAGWLNPILIKEARQSLKSRQFLITFFVLLAASCLWTIWGVVSNAPEVYYLPTGNNLLVGYYLVLAIPLIGMVPLAAYRSLAAELEDGTFEMLAITRLTAGRIVMGKFNSAMLQMLIYFAAIVPCIAFSYLLRGVTLSTIGTLVAIVFATALLITSLALLLATLARNRAGQTLLTLLLVAAIVGAEIVCGTVCLGTVLYANIQDSGDFLLGLGVFVLLTGSTIAILIKAAAGQIAPVTENRSTGLRWCLFGQALLWVAIVAASSEHYQTREFLPLGSITLGVYWLVIGTLMLGESSVLSPRVMRGLPQTFLGRMLLTWFNPGPETGYVFAIATGTIGILSLGVFSLFIEARFAQRAAINLALVSVGYLLCYLGATRLLTLPFSRRFGPSYLVSSTILAGLLAAGVMVPFVVELTTRGTRATGYDLLHVSNWAWTIDQAWSQTFDPAIGFFLISIGLVVSAINLLLIFRIFGYRRVSVPDRVRQDQAVATAGRGAATDN